MGKYGKTPISTPAFGCIFRSRLEVRLVCTLTALNVEWKYEPKYFKITKNLYYLPDLKCNYKDTQFWLEAKPRRPNKKEVTKACGLARIENIPVLLTTSNPFFDRTLEANIYWKDERGRICNDKGNFHDFLGISYLEYAQAVNRARDAFDAIPGITKRRSNKRFRAG